MSLYDNAVDEVKGAETPIPSAVSLAKVTSLSNGKASVQFYGESEPSTKLYPYIEGYKPAVDDVVCMLVQGNTFIILGKISNANIVDNYKPTAAEIAGAYLTQQSAADTYLSKTDASNDYLSKTDAANTYRGKDAYFDRLGSGNNYILISGAGAYVYGSLDLGNASYRLRAVTSTYTDTDHIRTPSGSAAFDIGSGLMTPSSNNGSSIGTSSKKLYNLYATNIYGSVSDSSDRRFKKTIKTLGRKWLDFFYRLRPTSFKYKDGTSDRTHTGFIAQEVEEAARESGMGLHDIAAIVIDSDGRYSLRYQELIAVQTLAIHDLKFEVDELTRRVAALERAVRK